MRNGFLLTLSCPDRPGVVAEVTAELHGVGANILEAAQFEDGETGRFFMRVAFALPRPEDGGAAAGRIAALAPKLDLDFDLRPSERRRKVLILVSRFDHCLVDLLYRQRTGELPMDLVGVVSNHPRSTFDDLGGIDFDHLPVDPADKRRQEARIRALVEERSVDLVILARYMQILSDDLAAFLSGRCINIHHSFLPGFKGARPYHQAYARGVKMIGATAHYVTGDLDEGPIISQDVEHISHADTPERLVMKGRDIERRVLARAVLAHLEDRVLLNGSRTVVFPG